MNADESVRYFSNGTEGGIWMSEWCNRCVHDHALHTDTGEGCEHILNTMVEVFDPVFLRVTKTARHYQTGEPVDYETWECIEFSRCPCDRGPDDPGQPLKPTPDPNQGALFDADALMPGVWRDVVLDELGPTSSPLSVTPVPPNQAS